MRILSIPTGGTNDLIKKYEIHSFPYPRPYDISGFVAFRKKGGFMERLYNIQQTIILEFINEDWEKEIDYLDTQIKDRIKGYIKERKKSIGFEKPSYMFWILQPERELYHEPRPPQNYNNHVYFDYDEICSGKEIVTINSKRKVNNTDNRIAEKEESDNIRIQQSFDELMENDLSNTENDIIVKGRIGQSLFKKGLLYRNTECEICALDVKDFLIASHIKAWRDSNSNERLDLNNGILLCPNHDWLFDKGYISFDENGYIMINCENAKMIQSDMNVNKNTKIKLNEKQKEYMLWHRENYFKK